MKKAFLLLMVVMVLGSTLWLKVSAASAASVKATVYSEFFTDVAAGESITAKINSSGADWRNLNCVTTEQPGYVSCQFPTEYAGQKLSIEFTKNKVMFIYTVDVPKN